MFAWNCCSVWQNHQSLQACCHLSSVSGMKGQLQISFLVVEGFKLFQAQLRSKGMQGSHLWIQTFGSFSHSKQTSESEFLISLTKNCWNPAEELFGFLCDPAEPPSAVLFHGFLSLVRFSAGCCRDVTPSFAADAMSCFGTQDSVVRNSLTCMSEMGNKTTKSVKGHRRQIKMTKRREKCCNDFILLGKLPSVLELCWNWFSLLVLSNFSEITSPPPTSVNWMYS